MKPGAVIVDLAGEAGGNCELSQPGETVVEHDVTIAAPLNVPSTMAEHASQLYARNVQSLLELMTGEDGALTLDFDDEIIAGACVTRDGEIVHEGARQAAGAASQDLEPTRYRRRTGAPMLVTNLAILVLAGFVGYAVISKVPNTLHTPLMSGTNAIHGIVMLGGLLVLGLRGDRLLNKLLLVIAIAFGTINVVGGFLVTDRMLEMFKSAARATQADARRRANVTPVLATLPAGRGLHLGPATSSPSRCSSTACRA